MSRHRGPTDGDVSALRRLVRVVVSVTVLTGVTVVVGFGGWLLLSVAALLGVYDPAPTARPTFRERLRDWPERNREVMRTNGREPLPLLP